MANRLIIRHFIHHCFPLFSTKNGEIRQTNWIMNRRMKSQTNRGMNRGMDRRMDRIVNHVIHRQGNHGKTTYLKVTQIRMMIEN